jgi:hypothetical protein
MANTSIKVTHPRISRPEEVGFDQMEDNTLYLASEHQYTGNVYTRIGQMLIWFDNGWVGAMERPSLTRSFYRAPVGTEVLLKVKE